MVRTHRIPKNADSNALGIPDLKRALENFLVDDARIAWFRENSSRLDHYLQFLAEITDRIQLSGSTVYYPLGGPDVKHPFLLVNGARDVFAQGGERFGSIASLENFMEKADGEDKSATSSLSWIFGGFLTFLETGDTQGFSGWRYLGTDGIGGLALADIVSIFGGKINGIHYFEIDDQGQPQFITRSQLDRTRSYDHAVIEFKDRSRQTKRFWYSKYLFNRQSPDRDRYQQFVNRIAFETLFIKGAFCFFSEEDAQQRAEIFDLILDPARERNANIITDERTNRYCHPLKPYQDGDKNHPIWRLDSDPRIITVPRTSFFEYGYGKNVYIGTGEQLVDRTIPVTELKGYEPRPDYGL